LSYTLPDFPDYPSGYTPTSSLSINRSNSGLTLYSADFSEKHYPSINIRSNSILNIDTGSDDQTLYVEDLNITSGHLNVTGTGTLTIYVEETFVLNGSSTINSNTRNSEKVMVYYGGSSRLQFNSSSKLYSNIFIDTADLKINGSGRVQGHIISGGSDVDISGTGVLNTRLLFVPDADVTLAGGSVVYGAIICNSLRAVGGATVDFSSGISTVLPKIDGNIDETDLTFTAFAWY
jgi:cytoskeletal protein CcmA (bactofilin family)